MDRMDTYSVDITLNRPPTEDEIDLLFEAGQQDSVFGEYSREAGCSAEANSLAAATRICIAQIESVNDLKVESIGLPDPVTISDIATLTERTPESVRLLAAGKRGPGNFPKPSAEVGGTRLWDLVNVANWWVEFEPDGPLNCQHIATISAINNCLAARKAKAQLPADVQAEISALAA